MTIAEKTRLLKNKAFELGFDLCGIAHAQPLHENEAILRKWIADGMHAGMKYMERNIEKRTNPDVLLPGAESVIVTGLNYFSMPEQKEGVPVISVYAYGEDYHDVIMKRLTKLATYIGEIDPLSESRMFVDSAPVLEKAWAMRAGLGWQGKHSIVINKAIGSFFFLGVIITSTTFDYDSPSIDHCGECRVCIDECPVNAINEDRTIDARKCIACTNLEKNAPIEISKISSLGGRLIGCDKCQQVCPWNRHARVHNHPEFNIPDYLRSMTQEDWLSLSEDDYNRIFGESAIKRLKYKILMENVTNVTKSINKDRS